MPEFLKNRRNLFIIACILFLLCSVCIVVAFLVWRNSQSNTVINLNYTTVSEATPTPTPTPVPPAAKTPITLKYPEQFTKVVYTDEGCGHQTGLVTYTYNLDPTIRVGQLVISNKNLTMDADQKADFQNVIDVIDGTKTVVNSATPTSSEISGLPLRATATDCGGAAYYPAETFSVDYPGVDKALAIMTLGGTQSYFDDMTQVDMTLFIYAKKGDEVAEETLRFKAGEVFSAIEGGQCETTQDGNTFIDPQCVVDNARGNGAKLDFYKTKAVALMNIFQLLP